MPNNDAITNPFILQQLQPQPAAPPDATAAPGADSDPQMPTVERPWYEQELVDLFKGVPQGLAEDIAPTPADPDKPLTVRDFLFGNPLEHIPGVRSAENWLYNYGRPRQSDTAGRWIGQTIGNIAPTLAIPEAKIAEALRISPATAQAITRTGGLADRAVSPLASLARKVLPAKRGNAASRALYRGARKAAEAAIGGSSKAAGPAARAVAGAAGGALQPGDRDENAVAGAVTSALLGPAGRALQRAPSPVTHVISHTPSVGTLALLAHYLGRYGFLPSLATGLYGYSTLHALARLLGYLPAATEGAAGAKVLPAFKDPEGAIIRFGDTVSNLAEQAGDSNDDHRGY